MTQQMVFLILSTTLFILGIMGKVRAEVDIVDGKIQMPFAELTSTNTVMPYEGSRLSFSFVNETSVFHDENKTVRRPEVAACAASSSEHFFDSIFKAKALIELQRLEKLHPEMKIAVTIQYKTFQHNDFFRSKTYEFEIKVKNRPHRDYIYRHALAPVRAGTENDCVDCNQEQLSTKADEKNLCLKGDYALLLLHLMNLESHMQDNN